MSFKEESLKMSRTYQWMAILGLLAAAAGCGERAEQPAPDNTRAPAADSDTGEEVHSHGEGPNGGEVADWGGGKYHVEFTVNHDEQEATVYVLGSDAQSQAPIETEKLLLSISDPSFQVDLMPAPLEGESDAMSSRFVGEHEKLGVVQEFAGTISGEVEGTPYAGDFQEEAP